MASFELLRNGNVYAAKEKRLRSLARRAGELEVKAMAEGNRSRAVHFMQRMYRMQGELARLEKESRHA